jgi:hypothetical protein
MKSYWDSLAHQFQHQQSPLRPSTGDIRIINKIVGDWHRQYASPRTNALLLGVTPELANLSWPANTFLLALEKSSQMIDNVWPGNISRKRRVIRKDWFQAKIKKDSMDLIVGDGFLTAFAYPFQYSQMAETISQWLKPDGLFIARLFVQGQKRETMNDIIADLKTNQIRQFDTLKWRLAMALQPGTRDGVALDDIYRAWTRIEKEIPALLEQTGWPRPTVNTIRLYENRSDLYTFPTLEELNAAFSPHLKPVSTTVSDYEFAQHCPTLVYQPIKKGSQSRAPVSARSVSSVPAIGAVRECN